MKIKNVTFTYIGDSMVTALFFSFLLPLLFIFHNEFILLHNEDFSSDFGFFIDEVILFSSEFHFIMNKSSLETSEFSLKMKKFRIHKKKLKSLKSSEFDSEKKNEMKKDFNKVHGIRYSI